MNDAVLFHSDRFSLEPTAEGDKVYDLPLGDDLAAVLRERLLELAPGLLIDEPIREDWGTVPWVKKESDEYHINIHGLPGDDFENRQGITFQKIHGLVGVLLKRPRGPGECRALQHLVAHVLADDAETFQGPEWLAQDEYEDRRS